MPADIALSDLRPNHPVVMSGEYQAVKSLLHESRIAQQDVECLALIISNRITEAEALRHILRLMCANAELRRRLEQQNNAKQAEVPRS